VLRAVVSDYVRTGEPVGSSALVSRYRLKVSAATIRNDMSALEDEGYITQPYTSAGRIPTGLGYRWFVDNWPDTKWPDLSESAERAIATLLQSEFKGLPEALGSSSLVLSELTESAAVAVAPPSLKNTLRRIELFRRDSRRATLLLIADSGEVDQGIVEFDADTSEAQLSKLAERLNRELTGNAFEDLALAIIKSDSLKDLRARVAKEVNRMIISTAAARVFRGGTANILSPEKFSDISVAHQIVKALEEPSTLSALLNEAKGAGAMVVVIGSEIPVEQMRTCAAVFAPYRAGDDRQGSVGVIGPMRMDYPQTISAVGAIARSLSQLFEPGASA